MHMNLNVPANTVKKATHMLYSAPTQLASLANLPASKQKFPVLTVDKDTYVVGAHVQTNLDTHWSEGVYNLQIGKFSVVEDEVTFMIDADRDTESVIQGYVSILDARFQQLNHRMKKRRHGQILIENDCWIGHGATILAGVTIHHGAVVSANAVVTKDVPPYAIVAGNPAQVVKYRFDQDTIRKMLQVGWWNWEDDVMLARTEDFMLPAAEFAQKHLPEAQRDWGQVELYDICKLSPKGIKTYLFFIDCDEIHPLYEKVIHRFVKQYHHFDAELVLYLAENSSRYEEYFKQVMNYLEKWKDMDCYINICNKPLDDERAIFHAVSCYVTNRSRKNLQRVELAERCAIPCIAGTDPDCFA